MHEFNDPKSNKKNDRPSSANVINAYVISSLVWDAIFRNLRAEIDFIT